MATTELIAEAKSLWNEHGYRLDTTTPEGRLAMLAPMLAIALETALAEVERLNRALGQYGAHSGGCNVWSNHMECNCGFRSCLEGAKEKLC